jgi:hypothetical protein
MIHSHVLACMLSLNVWQARLLPTITCRNIDYKLVWTALLSEMNMHRLKLRRLCNVPGHVGPSQGTGPRKSHGRCGYWRSLPGMSRERLALHQNEWMAVRTQSFAAHTFLVMPLSCTPRTSLSCLRNWLNRKSSITSRTISNAQAVRIHGAHVSTTLHWVLLQQGIG